MAHVVNAHNKHLYENEFDEFLRRRHDFFVHQKHWRPPSPDGRELDQFDTDAATYLLGIEDGRVVTSARLIPTSEPHMVSEVFSHMCEKSGVPRRPDWAEWTRTFVVPDKRSTGLRGTLTQLCCAVMEYALDEGLSAVGGVQETYFMPHHGGAAEPARTSTSASTGVGTISLSFFFARSAMSLLTRSAHRSTGLPVAGSIGAEVFSLRI
ncbi:acyl-homoserine-lactone synthase [Mesorhizobium sp. M1322]|uniref:acyl-homoserine-lactone synthase n=1 Tax=Mesorhizobium sp. M1322 TaxID=2957081 RepID=UPI00333BCECA